MRGTHDGEEDAAARVGIIPAHAGNTDPRAYAELEGRDHPRACGEHWSMTDQIRTAQGSSPRMRGTHYCCDADDCDAGIIPAHAGNT